MNYTSLQILFTWCTVLYIIFFFLPLSSYTLSANLYLSSFCYSQFTFTRSFSSYLHSAVLHLSPFGHSLFTFTLSNSTYHHYAILHLLSLCHYRATVSSLCHSLFTFTLFFSIYKSPWIFTPIYSLHLLVLILEFSNFFYVRSSNVFTCSV